jgi:hypothetical protein
MTCNLKQLSFLRTILREGLCYSNIILISLYSNRSRRATYVVLRVLLTLKKHHLKLLITSNTNTQISYSHNDIKSPTDDEKELGYVKVRLCTVLIITKSGELVAFAGFA